MARRIPAGEQDTAQAALLDRRTSDAAERGAETIARRRGDRAERAFRRMDYRAATFAQ